MAVKVLVVSSPFEGRDRLIADLRSKDLFVECAGSAAECIQLVRQNPPHVIVMDRVLSDGDGWELVRVLKSLSSTRDVRVIAVSEDGSGGHLERAFMLGCEAFLVKPFGADVLSRQIRRLLPGTPV